MISEKHQCIFIHIPKTAGSSVEKKLGLFDELAWGVQDHSTIKDIQPLSFSAASNILRSPQEGYSRKDLLKEYLFGSNSGKRVSKETFDSYYKFAIVRNPWRRVYSWYQNVMSDEGHGVPECDFVTFLKEHGDNWALKSQLFWLEDFCGKVPMDKVVKFENLAEEMSQVFEKLGFTDTSLPHLLDGSKRTSIKGDFKSDYTPEAIEIVADRYQKEIELFDYQFE